MAGWSNIGGCNSLQKFGSSVVNEENKLKSSFDELISAFLEENCSSKCFRPLPPMLGNGHSVDLLKLYFVVKLKGGFDAISRKRIWDEVGLLYGLGIGFGSSLKLIYLKYLDSIEAWLVKLSKGGAASGRFSSGVWSKGVEMALGSEYSNFVSNMMEEMRKNDEEYCLKEEKSGLSYVDLTNDDDDEEEEDNGVGEKVDWEKFVISFVDSKEGNEDAAKVGLVDGVGFTGESNDEEEGKQMKSEMSYAGVVSSDLSDDGGSWVNPVVGDNVVKSSENSSDSKKCSAGEEELVMDSSVLKEEILSLKRKRESFAGMIRWMVNAAKNPTDPKIGTIPECSNWGSYGNDNRWKQVLLAREALFLKKSAEQAVHQKRHKMHPSMFDDNGGPRASPRLFFEKYPNGPPFEPSSINIGRPRQRLVARLDMQPTAPIYTSRPQQRIPIGHDFQVEVPEWTGVVAKSDSKWLGTRVWPLERRENTSLVERDPIGQGREVDCGCLFPGTLECVKFHIAKRRTKLKYELASVFYTWKFDKMGEDCSISWTSEEEKLFNSVVKANPLSGQKRFWKQMCEVLPQKNWIEKVNYYYNVFVLRRRAFQNRHTPRNIDSDDDETEYGSISHTLAAGSCSSIFSSKKVNTNVK